MGRPGLLLHDEPGVHPRAALAPAQGGAVPRLRAGREIRLLKLFTDEVVTFAVTGDEPAVVDMPTFWAHSITNTGAEPLVTLFFADELYDPANPDTIPEDV